MAARTTGQQCGSTVFAHVSKAGGGMWFAQCLLSPAFVPDDTILVTSRAMECVGRAHLLFAASCGALFLDLVLNI